MRQTARLLVSASRAARSTPPWAQQAQKATVKPGARPTAPSPAAHAPHPSTASTTVGSSSTSASRNQNGLQGSAADELRASNGARLPPGARPVPQAYPGGPRTDRKKSLLDSFRSLQPNQRIAIGLLLAGAAGVLMWFDRAVGPEPEQPAAPVLEEGEKKRPWVSVRTVPRE